MCEMIEANDIHEHGYIESRTSPTTFDVVITVYHQVAIKKHVDACPFPKFEVECFDGLCSRGHLVARAIYAKLGVEEREPCDRDEDDMRYWLNRPGTGGYLGTLLLQTSGHPAMSAALVAIERALDGAIPASDRATEDDFDVRAHVRMIDRQWYNVSGWGERSFHVFEKNHHLSM
jgi:hypothetical protein